MTIDDREIGSEMKAEGWTVVGGDWIMWLHPPTQRSVCVDGPYAWCDARVPTLFDVPTDPQTQGYVVSCRTHDEHGNPVEGESFWVESYGEAVRHARRIRQTIVEERERHRSAVTVIADQLTLDDAAGRLP